MMFLELFGAWLFADFITGLAHWAEDKLIVKPSRFSFLENIRKDNDLHHSKPHYMLRHTVSENVNTSVAIAWPIACFLVIIGAPAWVALGFLFAGLGNLIHRFAHEPQHRLSPFIRRAQKLGLFVNLDQHWTHHWDDHELKLISKEETKGNFCVMTSYLNPILDGLRFWRLLEFLFVRKEFK